MPIVEALGPRSYGKSMVCEDRLLHGWVVCSLSSVEILVGPLCLSDEKRSQDVCPLTCWPTFSGCHSLEHLQVGFDVIIGGLFGEAFRWAGPRKSGYMTGGQLANCRLDGRHIPDLLSLGLNQELDCVFQSAHVGLRD